NAAPTLGGGAPPIASQAVFGGDVKVAADKENNSLIITASKQDYDTVKTILAKIDIPRDQVYVKAVILEMTVVDGVSWGIDYYKFIDGTNGIARAGFRGTNGANLTNPSADSGLVLGFGAGKTVSVDLDGAGPLAAQNVKDTLALVNFLKKNGNANILSTPQITATDNEEAEIIVGENVPISANSTVTSGGASQASIERKDLNLKLTLTPFISPDTDSVRMKIAQSVDSLSNRRVGAAALADNAVAYATRSIKTNIIVNSNDTAVLGGLMRDEDTEEVTKVPILGDIPILGWLFKSKVTSKNKTNLLVFITPKIMRNSQDNADLLNTKLNERIDFIQQSMKGRDPHGIEIDKLPRKALNESETEEYIEQKGSDSEPIQAPTEENIDTEEYEEAPPENAPSNVNGRNNRRSPKKASKIEKQYAKRK
ncbi:MAG: secretin N-terminal domain-containing protein, partial [Bdellovibrionota bacterium]